MHKLSQSIFHIMYDGLRKTIESVIAQSCKDFDGMSTVYYKDVEKEKQRVLQSFLPAKILQDYHKFAIGDNWEDKLYIAIKASRFHGVIYSFNVCLIKFLQMFKKGAFWIKEYPVKLK